MSKKLPGWENRLIAYLRQCGDAPFRPGKLDCAKFASGACKAMTGEDILCDINYRTIESGLKQLQKMGYADHIEYFALHYPERASILMAQRGDLVAIEDDGGNLALGVVQGEMVYVMGLTGLGLLPLTKAKKAFAV